MKRRRRAMLSRKQKIAFVGCGAILGKKEEAAGLGQMCDAT